MLSKTNAFRSKEEKNMSCYKDGGCGIYEMYSCYECPASKPEYLKESRASRKDYRQSETCTT